MYRVIVRFKDLQDKDHVYNVGDKFPHNNRRWSKKRIQELMSSDNKRGQPLIEEVADE